MLGTKDIVFFNCTKDGSVAAESYSASDSGASRMRSYRPDPSADAKIQCDIFRH